MKSIFLLFLITMVTLNTKNLAQDECLHEFGRTPNEQNDSPKENIFSYPDFFPGLYLFADDKYIIDASYSFTEDIIFEVCISYGSYTQNDAFIELRDQLNGFTMLLKEEDGFVEFKKAFGWLKNKRLFRTEPYFYMDDEIRNMFNSKVDNKSIALDRERFKKQNNSLNKFVPGVYIDKKKFWFHELDLKANHRYTLTYKEVVLSEGKWTRKGNELILHDTALDFDFHVLIGKNELISKQIPADVEGITFVRKNPE